MAKVLQIIDVTTEGWSIRLSDGSSANVPYGAEAPQVGDEFEGSDVARGAHVEESAGADPSSGDLASAPESEGHVGAFSLDNLTGPDSTDEPPTTDAATEEPPVEQPKAPTKRGK